MFVGKCGGPLSAFGVSCYEASSDRGEHATYVVWEQTGFLATPHLFEFAKLHVMLFDTGVRSDRVSCCSINDRLVSRQWEAIFDVIILVSCFRGLSCVLLPKFFSFFGRVREFCVDCSGGSSGGS